jgi:hypothetical protein
MRNGECTKTPTLPRTGKGRASGKGMSVSPRENTGVAPLLRMTPQRRIKRGSLAHPPVMRKSLWILTLAFALVEGASAQQGVAPAVNLSDTISRTKSPDLHTREDAFNQLMVDLTSDNQGATPPLNGDLLLNGFFTRHPDQAEAVKIALIKLLTTENETFLGKNVQPGTYTEEDEEHYASVIDTVASLNDERAIPALAGAMLTGGMAQRGLMKYGQKALGPVLDHFKSGDSLMRAAALGTAVTILRAATDPASLAQSIALLRSSLADADTDVRQEAVMLLDCSGARQDFVSELEELAKSDPARYPGRSDDAIDGNWHYPVRIQARRVLRDIQNNKTCRQNP